MAKKDKKANEPETKDEVKQAEVEETTSETIIEQPKQLSTVRGVAGGTR